MSKPDFGFETTAEEIAKAYTDQIQGKTILITGVTPNGLGLYAAKTLAAHSPRLLILAARSQRTLDAAVAEINGACATKTLLVDLSSIKNVRAAADTVNSWSDVPTIDVVINNAGIMATLFAKTEDGIEQQLATNHIGHFLLTNLIMEKVIAAKGRVVSVSSGGHLYGPFRFDDYNFKVRICPM
jgi:NAD(P)-dependent dehydrogenase (short-subunit alcohol dehydrogenase family)